MAVPEQTPYKEYDGNGVTKTFTLEFICESKDHLNVTIDGVEPEISAWSFNANTNSVTFSVAPATDSKIVLQRNTPMSRTTNYQSTNNSMTPKALNADIDRVWLKLQELGIADMLLKIYVDRLHGEQKKYIDQKDTQLQNNINTLSAYVNQQDAQLQQNIDNLKIYVDDKDDELRAYLLKEIRKQGVALDQLDEYYNYLMQRLAQIAVDKGWEASFVVDASGKNQQLINDLNNKKFYSVLEEGASLTATASENYDAIQRAITKAQATNGVVWFPQLTSSFQDAVVPDGFRFDQQIVFPPKVSVKMDTPLIWTGDNNTIPLVYGQALPANKSQFSEYIQVDVWLYNQNAADWGNDNNIGVWMYPHQFCRINLKVVQGFECGIVLNADKQGFVYNHIFVDELRGSRIGMKWLATNMGWVNENTFYKGRIASGPTPSGKESLNRYGVIGTTDNYSIENNHWLNPCFELGHNTETVESVPIVLHNSSNNTFNNIRAENHKKWIARYTGASSANLITSDYGRLDSTVPLANMGSDWLAVDDQTTYKNNLFINRKYDDLFYRPFSKIRVDNFKDKFYGLDGGFAAVSGLASVTTDAYPSVPAYSRGAYGDTVNADGALTFGGASVRRVIRIKTNGAKKIVVKQSGSISGLVVKTFDTSKNLLYSTTTQYAKELNVNGSGGTAIATFGGSYALNTPLHGVSVVGLHDDVAYIDLLIGGSGASIYSVEVSTTDSVQLEQIPFFSKKAHSVKPTLITNVDEFTVVYNSAFTGTGAYGWILAGGAWRTVNAVGLSASKTYDPPSLASGETQSTTVTLTGATVGDAVTCSFSLVLSGTRMWAEVTAANLVTVYHRNDTGATVDLASGTLTVKLI